MHADSEFGENALLVWEWRGDAFTGCWPRFGKGLCSTWPDKKKDYTDGGTSMRIREKKLISIILMNFFSVSVKKRKIQDLWTSGKFWGECGEGVVGGQFDIWSHRGHSVVMRRSRSDQSKRVCPSAQLSLIHRQARWQFGLVVVRPITRRQVDSSLMESN